MNGLVTSRVSQADVRRYLVVVRAGDKSLHLDWLKNGVRNFDLFVSYYGQESGQFHEQAEYYEVTPGLKWPSLAQIFFQQRDLLLRYKACWFPDDDLQTDCQTINAMFALFEQYELWLAQPALGAGSHVAHWITTAIPGNRLRFTDFVEVMCPLIERDSLGIIGPSFSESTSGWGLDFLWPYLLHYPKNRIAILDETPVLHTRAARSGPFYQRCAELGVDPWAEIQTVAQKYGFEPWRMSVYDTIPKPATPDTAAERV